MKRIAYILEVGFCGCQSEGTMEVSDDMTPGDIDSLIWEMAREHGQSWEGDTRLYSEEEWENPDTVEMFYEGCYGSWTVVGSEE